MRQAQCTFALAALLLSAAVHAEMQIGFADPAWDGRKIPSDQVCRQFKGRGGTPPLVVSALPAGTTALVVEFSDQDARRFRNGGHGVLRFEVPPGSSEYTLPVVPGESDALPAGVSEVRSHRMRGVAGTYLPPCSGGRGNTYVAEVTAEGAGGELGSAEIKLGNY